MRQRNVHGISWICISAPNIADAAQLYEAICKTSPDFMKAFSEACRLELRKYAI